MRIVFFGSPDFAVPTLQTLASDAGFEVALVVTQAAQGVSPVERCATALGLSVYKPETLRNPVAREPLIAAGADVFVVAAFGLIFRRSTLEIPRFGCVNVHPSLLPAFRGASPILATVAQGVAETGVSLMVMDEGIDTGAVVSVERVVVDGGDTTASLGLRLAHVGAAQAVRDIPRWVAGELVAMPQPEAGASLTRPLTKADGWIDWTRPAVDIERHVRAMWPWPRAWTTVDGSLMQVHGARIATDDVGDAKPGIVVRARKNLVVATGRGALELTDVEPAGRRAMTVSAYLNGLRAPLGRLGEFGAPPPQPPLVVPVPARTVG